MISIKCHNKSDPVLNPEIYPCIIEVEIHFQDSDFTIRKSITKQILVKNNN